MNFNNYKIPKEYTDKFKVTERDKRQFKKFWNDELILLNKMNNLSKDDIEIIHKSIISIFWIAKGINKEKFTPSKYKKSIYSD